MKSVVWAAVALKSPATAKSRLSAVLSVEERRQLYFIMARGVIAALQASEGIDKVMVVAPGGEAAEFATRAGAKVIRQDEERGTAAAFAYAVDAVGATATANRPDGLLMIAGDLPLASPAEVSRLLEAGREHALCIVPDRKKVGTNALLCTPPDLLRPCFGSDSFSHHCRAARERQLAIYVHESHELSLDIDVADDLALLGAHLLGVGNCVPAPVPTLLRCLASGYISPWRASPFRVRYG